MENMEERILSGIDEYSDILREKNVVLYGCTFFTKRVYMALCKKNIYAGAIVDNDKSKAGKQYLGINIYLPGDYLLPYNPENIVIVCSVHEQEMLLSLHEMGYGAKNILHISSETEIYADTLEYMARQMKTVRRGIRYYQKIAAEYAEDTIFLVAPKASGDIFIAYSYLQAWRLKYDVKSCVLLGVGNNVRDIADLYGIKEKNIIISERDLNDMIAAYMFIGELMNIKFISEWILTIRNSYFPRCNAKMVFIDKFRLETFRLTKKSAPLYPSSCMPKHGFAGKGMPEGKTIIMSPYAYSSPAPMISQDIWVEIAGRLLKKGYAVYTVGYGEKEPVIRGTERIQFSYKEARGILEYAGGFLSARSGLCDIVHMAECRQLVIYGRNIRNDYAVDFFSLRRNYSGFNGEEIVFDDFNRQDFVDYVVQYFERQRE